MKINLKNSKNLSRNEMKKIVAGFVPQLFDETATVTCKDNSEHTVASCDQMEAKCSGHGGAKICSGGGN